MEFNHILAAADDSEVGRTAVMTAAAIAEHSGARLTILNVLPPPATDREQALEWLRGDLGRLAAGLRPEPAVAVGLPGIEIPRYAEEHEVDLVVLGRNPRSLPERLLIGDTADAVARRSSVPCLFVPKGASGLTRIVAAVDGTERGFGVLVAATDFTHAVHGRLRVISVEPVVDEERSISSPHLPNGRTARLAQALDRMRVEQPVPWDNWEPAPGVGAGSPLVLRRGDPAEEILGAVQASGADVLVFGYRRGGPPGLVEGKSVGRRLAHGACCATLTIPL